MLPSYDIWRQDEIDLEIVTHADKLSAIKNILSYDWIYGNEINTQRKALKSDQREKITNYD